MSHAPSGLPLFQSTLRTWQAQYQANRPAAPGVRRFRPRRGNGRRHLPSAASAPEKILE